MGRKAGVTGTATADFTATGTYLTDASPGQVPFVSTVASGSLELTDGTAFGYPISSATAAVTYADNKLSIENAEISSEDAHATIGGQVLADTRTLDLRFNITGFDLARVRERVREYVVLAGIANATGTLTGDWKNPAIAANLGIDNLSINNERFDQAQLSAVYSDDALSSAQMNLSRNGQLYQIQAADFDLRTNCMKSATGRITGGSVPDIWGILNASPYLASPGSQRLHKSLQNLPRLTSGVLNLEFQLSGCLSHPDGLLKFTATKVGVDIQRIESVTGDITAKNGAIWINQLRAVSGEASVEVAPATPGAPVYEDGRIQLALSANNFDLSQLRPWFGINTPSGVLTADFVAQGEARAPRIRGSVEVTKPGFGKIQFDSLRIARVEVTNNHIELSDMILAVDNHQAVAQGYLPWSWSGVTIPRNRPLEFTANLNKEDLSILAAFSSEIDAARTSGALSACSRRMISDENAARWTDPLRSFAVTRVADCVEWSHPNNSTAGIPGQLPGGYRLQESYPKARCGCW